MATRHLARTIVVQSLYEWDFYNREADLIKIVERNMVNFGAGIDEPDFVWRMVKGVVEHLKEIDAVIEKAAPEWPLKAMVPMGSPLRLAVGAAMVPLAERVP